MRKITYIEYKLRRKKRNENHDLSLTKRYKDTIEEVLDLKEKKNNNLY